MKNTNVSSNRLIELGLYPQHLGFGYLTYAISIVSNDPVGYYSHKIDIFELLRQNFDVPRGKASRCMHYSIENAWNLPSNVALHALFPNCSEKFPPSVIEFICRIAVEVSDWQATSFAQMQ